MNARAAISWEPGDFSVQEVDVRAPTRREVLIRLAASGLCGSDLGLKTGRNAASYPIIGGHEGAGVVEAVGEAVESVAVGDHVVTSPIPQCGHCRYCTQGRPNLCDMVGYAGVGVWPGAEHPATVDGEGVAAFCLLGTFSDLSWR
jgi:Zn-dependent alcohol dehydrogenase